MEPGSVFVRGIKRTASFGSDADDYIKNIPAIANLMELNFEKPVTILIGENGSGKSTLLESIAVAFGFNAEGGSRNFNFSSKSTHSNLHELITLIKGPFRPKDGYFLRAESFYNVATNIDEMDPPLLDSYGGKSLHAQSHGESFLSLVLNRFGGNGLYVLDEPEAALSPARQLSLLRRMHDLVESGSQFFIATHSPIIMAYPEADLFLLDERGINKTSYEQTEHYQITRRFLENPKRMLDVLFNDD